MRQYCGRVIKELASETKQFREGFFNYINNVECDCSYRLKDDPVNFFEWWNGYDEAKRQFGENND